MRALFVVLAILCCCGITVAAQAKNYRSDVQQKRWERAFRIRMHILERHYGITFDGDWQPRVTLGAPPNARYPWSAEAWYMPESERFYVAERLQWVRPNIKRCHSDVPALGETSPDRDKIRELIDHELGHRFTDQVRQQLGTRSWLTTADWNSMSFEDRVGQRMIVEGIGTYYGSTSLISATTLRTELGSSLLPTSINDSAWSDTDFTYEGGAWLVQPILETYGETGLVYLLTHCLTFSNGDVHSAAIAYQQQALQDLSGE